MRQKRRGPAPLAGNRPSENVDVPADAQEIAPAPPPSQESTELPAIGDLIRDWTERRHG